MKIKLLLLVCCIYSFGWSQCNINDATDCECLDSSENSCDLLPDIQASWDGILNYSGGPSEYPQSGAGENNGRLRISVSTPNTGYGPLTVRGIDEDGFAYFICDDDTISIHQDDLGMQGGLIGGYYCDGSDEPAKHIALQRIYHRNSDGTMGFYDRFAGTMTYHPTHGHMHSDEWGVFTLRVQDPDDPNPLNWPIVSNGAKMGFCLMDYYDCGNGSAYGHCRDENRYSEDYLEDYPEVAAQGFNGGNILTENNQFPNNGLGGQGYGCSVTEQGISVGWTDVYSEYLDDQWIDIDPGLCNGEYWIVGEIDRNNFYLESNKDNNWTAVPFTLTQQLESNNFEVEIVTESEPILCTGESIILSSSITNASMEYNWSNGMTGSSITVSEPGTYYVEVISACGNSTSESIEVVSSDIEEPVSENVTIDTGEIATLSAIGSGNIFWADENGNILGTGDTFVTPVLYENTSYFVYQEEEIITAPEFLTTGEEEHLCDGGGSCDYSGTVYNGGLRFEAINEFTLNSVKVYTDSPGERTIQLMDASLSNIFESLTINIPESGEEGYVIELNWTIPVGEYIITTDAELNNTNFGDNNPMLKRTTGGLATFPHTINSIVSINDGYYNSDGNNPEEAGFSTSYYYYFYDWKINNEWNIGGISCSSETVEVVVLVNNNTEIQENKIEFSLFPNPASKELNIKPEAYFNETVSIYIINEIGEEIEKIHIENFNESINLDIENYSSGLYFIKIKSSKGIKTKSIMFN